MGDALDATHATLRAVLGDADGLAVLSRVGHAGVDAGVEDLFAVGL